MRFFPSRTVPVLTMKCTMADKSTKTDDALLNGELEAPCPTTTNAATMTTGNASEAPSRTTQVAASTSTRTQVTVQRQDSRSSDGPRPQPPSSPPTVCCLI